MVYWLAITCIVSQGRPTSAWPRSSRIRPPRLELTSEEVLVVAKAAGGHTFFALCLGVMAAASLAAPSAAMAQFTTQCLWRAWLIIFYQSAWLYAIVAAYIFTLTGVPTTRAMLMAGRQLVKA